MRKRGFIDWEAIGGYLLALIVFSFGLFALLVFVVALLEHILEGTTRTLVAEAFAFAVFATTTALLVRALPSRTLLRLAIALYVVDVGSSLVYGVMDVATPSGAALRAVSMLAGSFTLGLVGTIGTDPTAIGFPHVGAFTGLLAGFFAMRWLLTRQGVAVGEAAEPEITPIPLPSRESLQGLPDPDEEELLQVGALRGELGDSHHEDPEDSEA